MKVVGLMYDFVVEGESAVESGIGVGSGGGKGMGSSSFEFNEYGSALLASFAEPQRDIVQPIT